MKKIIAVLILGLLVLASCGKQNSADIINPDAPFLYFYGWSCPHCQELNKQMDENNIYAQVPIEKREVYANNANRELFLETVQGL